MDPDGVETFRATDRSARVRTVRSRRTMRVAVAVELCVEPQIRDEVDVVAGRERSGEQLVRVAGDLHGAHRALQLRRGCPVRRRR